jgi:hypothetical protein
MAPLERIHVFIFTLVFWDKGYRFFFWLYALWGAILGASFVRNVTYGFVFLK